MRLANQRVTGYSLALLLLTLLGLAVRVYHLTAQGIWWDEAWSLWVAHMEAPQVIHLAVIDNHPPLYYLMLHYWVLAFGDSEFVVRFLSVIFSVLAIPMIYAVGRQLFDKQVGIVGALILSLSALNVQFAQETRMYSLMVLLALISMYFFILLLERPSLAFSVGYVAATALLLYNHVYGFFVVVAQNAYLLALFLLWRDRPLRLKSWVLHQAALLVLYIPWLVVLISQISEVERDFWIPIPTLSTLLVTFYDYAGTTKLQAIFLLLAVFSVISYRRISGSLMQSLQSRKIEHLLWEVRLTNTKEVCLLAVWLLVINIVPFAISHFSTPIYFYKYTIPASIALYLFVAAGIRNINWNYAKAGVILLISILSLALCIASAQSPSALTMKPQAREAVTTVVQNATGGDLVIVYPSSHALEFGYYNHRPDLIVTPAVQPFVFWSSSADKDVPRIVNKTSSDAEGHSRVWLVYANYEARLDQQAGPAISATLNESYTLSFSKHYVGYDVYLFEKRT
ncbi:MAG: glycosyltransferase family 39 protein [Halobacteriota archaeon]